MESQVISRQRVVDHGEVLTGKREVEAMLDLVKQETERIDSRFLDPACGTGNLLAPILERKLAVVEKRYAKAQLEFERNAVLAVSSLYGIDILSDNVSLCRERLFMEGDDSQGLRRTRHASGNGTRPESHCGVPVSLYTNVPVLLCRLRKESEESQRLPAHAVLSVPRLAPQDHPGRHTLDVHVGTAAVVGPHLD